MNTTNNTVKASDVTLVSLDVDHGDKQSYGEFSLTAQTPAGTLVGKGALGTDGSQQDQEWTLDGAALDDAPVLGLPHHYAGRRALVRFEKKGEQDVREALADWVNRRNSGEAAYAELFATVNGR